MGRHDEAIRRGMKSGWRRREGCTADSARIVSSGPEKVSPKPGTRQRGGEGGAAAVALVKRG